MALLLGFGQLFAQGQEKSVAVTLWAVPDEKVSFSTSVDDGEEFKVLELAQMKRSRPMSVAAGELHFHMKKDGEMRKLGTLGMVDVPDHALVVLKLGDDDACEMMVIPDDPKSLSYGSYYFYNHSEMSLEGKLGEEEFSLEAGKGMCVTPKVKDGDPLPFELSHEVDGKKKFLMRNTFNYKEKKYLVLFFDDDTSPSGRVRLKSKGLVAFQAESKDSGDSP